MRDGELTIERYIQTFTVPSGSGARTERNEGFPHGSDKPMDAPTDGLALIAAQHWKRSSSQTMKGWAQFLQGLKLHDQRLLYLKFQ